APADWVPRKPDRSNLRCTSWEKAYPLYRRAPETSAPIAARASYRKWILAVERAQWLLREKKLLLSGEKRAERFSFAQSRESGAFRATSFQSFLGAVHAIGRN